MADFANFGKIILEGISSGKKLCINEVSRSLIEYASKNKVLYPLGLLDERIKLTKDWIELEKRRKEQIKAFLDIIEIAEKHDVPFIIVKTIKPFAYVPDDIDVLIINDVSFKHFIHALLKRGYFMRKGTLEVTLWKSFNKIPVYIDVHSKLSAGTYEYIDRYYIWGRRDYKKLDDDLKVPVANPTDELLITAAHAVMKELQVLLADVLHITLSSKHDLSMAFEQAKNIGVFYSLTLLSSLANMSKYTNIHFPYRIPFFKILQAYNENINFRLKAYPSRALIELLRLSSSKGVGILFRYLGL